MNKSKNLKCPICSSLNITKYWAMKGYKLARCNNCTMVWDPYHLENVLAQYDKNYFKNDNPKGGYSNYFEGMRVNRRTFSERLGKIAKKIKTKTLLLDVGAALGDCLFEAKKMGWKNCTGLEVSKFAADFGKKRGLNILNNTLALSGLKDESFNVVTYQDVIEHVDDPVKELRLANKVIKRNGYIYLVTPDVGGLWHKLLKGLWYHYKPGEHIMYFSQKSLSLALQESGFKNIETRITYHVLSVSYVINRLKYYSPFIFENLDKIISKTGLKNYAFRAYTGEIEAWGQK
jgi:2-polyprenyl-3-methyl-5-hydroxy-6-metoxy-1,4-benzoquinol methylase